MKIFISGGCKNGKSTLAQTCACALANEGPLYYVATMIPHDGEDEVRIQRHIAAREGKGFITIEQGRNLLRCLDKADSKGTFLLDSVTALVSNEMFHDNMADENAVQRTVEELCSFAGRVKHAVFVSDYIFSDDRGYDEYTEAYRRGLALCDRALAALCDTVVDVCIGQYTLYKGKLPENRKQWGRKGEKEWI